MIASSSSFALVSSLLAGIALAPEGPPQLADTSQPFFNADPIAGDLKGALFLCRVDVVGEKAWDTFSAIDMRITVTAGARAPVVVWGPEDRSSAIVGFPGFDVKSGDKLKFVVEDRDVTENELVARGAGTFTGTPFRLDLQDTQIECHALSHDVALNHALPAIGRVTTSIATLERAEPRLDRAGLGLNDATTYGALDMPLAEATAWLGARDPQVAPLIARKDAALRAFDTKVRAAIEGAKKSLPAPGETFRIASLGLDAKITKDAAVTLEVTPSGANATFNDDDLERAVVFLSAADTLHESQSMVDRPPPKLDANGTYEPPKPTTLAKGQTARIRLRAAFSEHVPDLLRVDDVIVRAR